MLAGFSDGFTDSDEEDDDDEFAMVGKYSTGRGMSDGSGYSSGGSSFGRSSSFGGDKKLSSAGSSIVKGQQIQGKGKIILIHHQSS